MTGRGEARKISSLPERRSSAPRCRGLSCSATNGMEFWGVEVKPGETLTCDPGDDKYLHLSQAAIGETKDSKANERVSLYVHVDGKKLVLGTLSCGNCDQISLDLVFDKEFKLSHNLQSGSVFYCGYSTAIQDEEYGGLDGEDSESEDDELTPAGSLPAKENGKSGAGGAKPGKSESKHAKLEAAASGKAASKVKSAAKNAEDEKDEDEDEDDEDEDDEEMADLSDESDDEDEDEDEEDGSEDEGEDDKGQGNPKVETAGKKRLHPDSATKSPATEKKAKLTTPVGGEKAGLGEAKRRHHVPTPYPAKHGIKADAETPPSSVKQGTPGSKGASVGSKQNASGSKGTPKSNSTQGSEKKTGQFACQICSRSFTTEGGLNSHNAAKHAGGK